MKASGRTRYQMELIKILSEKLPSDYYPISVGSSSPIWDVILLKMIPGLWQGCMGIEVKSVNSGVYYFSNQKEQSDFYREKLDEYGMITCYAMRLVKQRPGVKIIKEEWWRFFWLNDANKKIIWEDGMTIGEFCKWVDMETLK